MPATHCSLYYHLIFSTKGRQLSIRESWEKRLHEYMGGIIRNLGGVAEEIGGASDHIHILASLKGNCSLSEIMGKVKANSSRWVHSEIDQRFRGWQDGYGAFTVSAREIEGVRKYIQGQKTHHYKASFQEEYINFLKECGVEFDEKYLW